MMVYFAIKNGIPVHHRDLEAMKNIDGLEPITSKSEAEFLSYDNLVRVIDGGLFFGKTNKEKADEAARDRIAEIDASLRLIDLKAGERPTRESLLWLKQKFGDEFDIGAVIRAEEYESTANELRTERQSLTESLESSS
jgi:hypothetical protein